MENRWNLGVTIIFKSFIIEILIFSNTLFFGAIQAYLYGAYLKICKEDHNLDQKDETKRIGVVDSSYESFWFPDWGYLNRSNVPSIFFIAKKRFCVTYLRNLPQKLHNILNRFQHTKSPIKPYHLSFFFRPLYNIFNLKVFKFSQNMFFYIIFCIVSDQHSCLNLTLDISNCGLWYPLDISAKN